VTSVGTSLITNGASGEEQRVLRASANKNDRELSEAERRLIADRCARARELLRGDDASAKRASAELNGLLSFYGGRRDALARDAHVLVGTDTAQGRATLGLIEELLRANGAEHVEAWVPEGFSTAAARGFTRGVREILRRCHDALPGYRDAGYAVVFNTVGGFKSQRDVLNIVGMFYADEILYIFEGDGAPLLRIPKLPIRIDRELFAAHVGEMLLFAAGLPVKDPAPPWLAETLLDDPDAGGGRLLSAWGDLVWNQVKDGLLAGALVPLPFVAFEPRFESDFAKLPAALRTRAQETAAEVAVALIEAQGDTSVLARIRSLNFERLHENRDLFTVRVNAGYRISGEALGGGKGVRFRRVGAHDDVYRNP
jgi:putative CRISPR-associated protein (TIGR02619 family)